MSYSIDYNGKEYALPSLACISLMIEAGAVPEHVVIWSESDSNYINVLGQSIDHLSYISESINT